MIGAKTEAGLIKSKLCNGAINQSCAKVICKGALHGSRLRRAGKWIWEGLGSTRGDKFGIGARIEKRCR